MNEDQKFTFDDLAERISKMDPEKRKQQVYASIDDNDKFSRLMELCYTEEDIYVHMDDEEIAAPLNELMEINGDKDPAHYILATPAGTPFIADDY